MIGLDYLDGTGYTTKYIFDKLYENNPKFVQKLDGSQVVKVMFELKIINLKI
jgi:hypothetical protein